MLTKTVPVFLNADQVIVGVNRPPKRYAMARVLAVVPGMKVKGRKLHDVILEVRTQVEGAPPPAKRHVFQWHRARPTDRDMLRGLPQPDQRTRKAKEAKSRRTLENPMGFRSFDEEAFGVHMGSGRTPINNRPR